jgi:ACS family hexuronate transporter-like MFS transporter
MPRRWWIAVLITVAIAISYLDRQTLPIAVDAVRRDIPISNTEFADLQVAFLVAYGLMYAGGGKLIDVLGTRRGFFVIMIFWSLACASHGLATAFWMLAVSRFLLGLGEGGGFPAATKAVAEWFPVQQRSSAMGLINAGTAVGAVIAPPAIAVIIGLAGWRWVFLLAGASGLAWTLWWLIEYFPPAQHPRLTDHERSELELSSPAPAQASSVGWWHLVTLPQVWGLVSAKFLSDAAWFFYLAWLPKYLYDVHGFNTKEVGYYAWIPYAAAGVGSLLGGWFSSWLVTRGYSLNLARKLALGISAALMPWVFLVTLTDVELALVLFSIAFFGQQSWSTLVMTIPADMFPRRVVGSVAGLVGLGGTMGGIAFNRLAGPLLDQYGLDSAVQIMFALSGSVELSAGSVIGPNGVAASLGGAATDLVGQALNQQALQAGYQVVFAMTSSFHIFAFLIILALVRRVQPLKI